MTPKKLFLPLAAVLALLLTSCYNKDFHQFLVIENGTSDTLRIAVAEHGQVNIGDVLRMPCKTTKTIAPDETFLIYDHLDEGHLQSETIDDIEPNLEILLMNDSKINNVRAYRHDTCIAIWENPGFWPYGDSHPYGTEFNSFYNLSSWKTEKSPSAYTFTFTVKEENYGHKIDYLK